MYIATVREVYAIIVLLRDNQRTAGVSRWVGGPDDQRVRAMISYDCSGARGETFTIKPNPVRLNTSAVDVYMCMYVCVYACVRGRTPKHPLKYVYDYFTRARVCVCVDVVVRCRVGGRSPARAIKSVR